MSDPHDIARAMVALPGWRWLPGMLTCGVRIDGERDGRPVRYESTRDWEGVACRSENYPWPGHDAVCAPDLTDAATLGAVEHGLLAPAGVGALPSGFPATAWRAAGADSWLGPWRDNLPAALLDGLRVVRS